MANSVILNGLLKELRYSINEFEKEIGVPKGRIYASIQRNSKLSMETVVKILTKFPQVNKDWLETGEGNMFVEKSGTNFEETIGNQITNSEKPDIDYQAGNPNNPLYSTSKNDLNMIYEMMGLMKHQNANVDKIAGALDKLADANQSMARSIERLIANGGEQEQVKRMAS